MDTSQPPLAGHFRSPEMEITSIVITKTIIIIIIIMIIIIEIIILD